MKKLLRFTKSLCNVKSAAIILNLFSHTMIFIKNVNSCSPTMFFHVIVTYGGSKTCAPNAPSPCV